MSNDGKPSTGTTHREEQRLFTVIFCCCFVVCLVAATLARLTGWRWRPWSPGPEGYLSIFAGARREAFTVAPVAFMG